MGGIYSARKVRLVLARRWPDRMEECGRRRGASHLTLSISPGMIARDIERPRHSHHLESSALSITEAVNPPRAVPALSALPYGGQAARRDAAAAECPGADTLAALVSIDAL